MCYVEILICDFHCLCLQENSFLKKKKFSSIEIKFSHKVQLICWYVMKQYAAFKHVNINLRTFFIEKYTLKRNRILCKKFGISYRLVRLSTIVNLLLHNICNWSTNTGKAHVKIFFKQLL